MGYPMTFQRVLKRSHLEDGDYKVVPDDNRVYPAKNQYRVETTNPEWYEDLLKKEINRLSNELIRQENRRNLLLGDLRRLEKDTADENSIAKQIGFRTGISADLVAAVLAEYIKI
jgi:hypothetical protein